MRLLRLTGLAVALGALVATSSAQAQYTEVDLSNYVNQGFNNGGWFINGADFGAIVGSTYGDLGSSVPFLVANTSAGNNFWYGLNTDGTNLAGSPISVTIPVTATGIQTVYTLADNTYGVYFADEFSITLTGASSSLTYYYVGGINTQDYNLNCLTTGCSYAPYAPYWFWDSRTHAQWLGIESFEVPAGFGLQSVTFTQINGNDGAIVAGLTLSTAPIPEPSTWAMLLAGFGALGFAMRSRRKTAASAA
jgi:hypothetical protein